MSDELSLGALEPLLSTRWLGRGALEHHATLGSTNDRCAERARAGARHGLVVIADEQTSGRGRQGRRWHSPPGCNLYVSALLRPPLPPAAAPPLTLAAGVALAEAAASVGAAPRLKWPNDLLVDGRKAGGILTELACRGERIEHLVIGVGVDVNDARLPPELAGVATSLARGLGRPVPRAALLGALLARLEHWYERLVADGPGPVLEAWRGWSWLGSRAVVEVDGVRIAGVAEEVDDDGALWLRRDDGRRVRVLAGEVHLAAEVAR